MRHAFRLPHLLMSCWLAAVLLAAGADAVAAAPSGAASSRLTSDSRAALAESTTELPGGITEIVRLLARESTSKDAGTPSVKQSVVEVTIERVTTATGAQISFFTGQLALAPNQLSFSSSLKSATLAADIPLTDFVTGASYILSANLAWRATDTTTIQTLTDFNRSPSLLTLTTYADRTRFNATISGSLTYALGSVTGLTGVLADQEVTSRTFLRQSEQAAPAHLTKTSVTVEGSALFAYASYNVELDPCIVATVEVTAEIPADAAPRADVRITGADNCAGSSVSIDGTFPVGGAFSVAPDFSTARLNTTGVIGATPITLDLTWSGGQELFSQTLSIENISPTESVTTIMQGNFSNATVAGSVTVAGHTLAVPTENVAYLGTQFAGVTTTRQ